MKIDLVIVGSARSGTTVLANKLANQYMLEILPETHYYSKFNGNWVNFLSSEYSQRLSKYCSQDLSGYNSIDEVLASLKSMQPGITYAEKTPLHLRWLTKFSKETKIIVIKRDFFQTFKSLIGVGWTANSSALKIALRVFLDKAYILFAKLRFRKRIFIVSYDDFVDNNKETISIIGRFLELSETRMSSMPKPNFDSSHEYWKIESAQPVLRREKILVGAWPRFGETNVRNTDFYDEVNKSTGINVIDVKAHPEKALFCDFIHLHWPEKVLEKNTFKNLAFLIWFSFCKFINVKFIQTLHNETKLESRSLKSSLFLLYFRNVDMFFCPSQNSFKCIPEKSRFKLLPLGLYNNYPDIKRLDKGYNLIIGRLTRKKNIIKMLKTNIENLKINPLIIAGKAEDNEYELEIINALDDLGLIKNTICMFETISEKKMHNLLAEAKCVMVDYETITNSGIATLAATYNVPVYCKDRSLAKSMKRIYNLSFTTDMRDIKEYVSRDLSFSALAIRYERILRNFKW